LVKIPIHYLPGSPHLEITDYGGCVDLYNYNELSLKAGEKGFINFGISMKLPEQYDALIFPRSSTFKRYGILLTNSVGYIDNSYNGTGDQWMACVYATKDIIIPKGTRCFQFRLIKRQPEIDFVQTDSLNSVNRGGYGSSGV
jgi:dUTP pyrophosphatase